MGSQRGTTKRHAIGCPTLIISFCATPMWHDPLHTASTRDIVFVAHKCGRTHAASFYWRCQLWLTSVQVQMAFMGPLKVLMILFCNTTKYMSKRLIFITGFCLMNATIFWHHETVQDSMRRRNLVRVDVYHVLVHTMQAWLPHCRVVATTPSSQKINIGHWAYWCCMERIDQNIL